MQAGFFKVTGMTCGNCVGEVTKALKAVNGASDVKVSLAAGEATVQFDERLTTVEQLKSAVQRAGYGVDGAESGRRDQGKGGCCGGSGRAAAPAAHGHQGKGGCCG